MTPRPGSCMTTREPNYLVLTIVQLVAIVLVTASGPLGPGCIAGILIAAGSLLLAAWMLTRRRRELLLAVVLGGMALLQLGLFIVRRRAIVPGIESRSMSSTWSSGSCSLRTSRA